MILKRVTGEVQVQGGGLALSWVGATKRTRHSSSTASSPLQLTNRPYLDMWAMLVDNFFFRKILKMD